MTLGNLLLSFYCVHMVIHVKIQFILACFILLSHAKLISIESIMTKELCTYTTNLLAIYPLLGSHLCVIGKVKTYPI